MFTRQISLVNMLQNLDVWREPLCVHCNVDIRLSREQYDDVTSVLSDNGFQPEVLIENVQTKIDWQMQPRGPEQPGLFDYSRYHRVEEVNIFHCKSHQNMNCYVFLTIFRRNAHLE